MSPRGFAAAKKVGEFKGGGGFQPRPRGIVYFSLKDQQTAKVRFLTMADEIDWARKWKLAPSGNFKYGELVNCVDQHEDGTPDPGYALGLRASFKAYPVLIWRGAPTFQKNPDGSLFKDGNGNKVLTGYADQVAVWECSWEVYNQLKELDQKYQGLMSRDFEVKRIGADKSTKYMILPEGDSTPLSPSDQQLSATGRIDTAPFVKIPTYEELNNYLTGNTEPAPQTPGIQQQADNNAAGAAGSANPFLS